LTYTCPMLLVYSGWRVGVRTTVEVLSERSERRTDTGGRSSEAEVRSTVASDT
jgi:chloramphenicol 3-O-phosphotransferase